MTRELKKGKTYYAEVTRRVKEHTKGYFSSLLLCKSWIKQRPKSQCPRQSTDWFGNRKLRINGCKDLGTRISYTEDNKNKTLGINKINKYFNFGGFVYK